MRIDMENENGKKGWVVGRGWVKNPEAGEHPVLVEGRQSTTREERGKGRGSSRQHGTCCSGRRPLSSHQCREQRDWESANGSVRQGQMDVAKKKDKVSLLRRPDALLT